MQLWCELKEKELNELSYMGSLGGLNVSMNSNADSLTIVFTGVTEQLG